MRKPVRPGSTLIEPLIVMAIVGSLAAIALLTYSDFLAQPRIPEQSLATYECKSAITGHPPAKKAIAGEEGYQSPKPTGCAKPAENASRLVERKGVTGESAVVVALQDFDAGAVADVPDYSALNRGDGTYVRTNFPPSIYTWTCNPFMSFSMAIPQRPIGRNCAPALLLSSLSAACCASPASRDPTHLRFVN